VTPCLLCPSPVVVDGLCVPCGARLWVAQRWEAMPNASAHAVHLLQNGHRPSIDGAEVRVEMHMELDTPEAARAFLDKLEAARMAREAAPLCPDGCMSHEEER
jgi:hypothetical protein